MLREISGVFADNPKCPSIAKGVKRKIDRGDAQPIIQRIYPVAPAVEEEIMTLVTHTISNGICRPSNSPWGSRVLLVSKRDGNTRFCVDFCELNTLTRSNSYPIPHPKDILDRMFGDTYFSFFDGAPAYCAIEIAEKDKFKTAFTTTKCIYEF